MQGGNPKIRTSLTFLGADDPFVACPANACVRQIETRAGKLTKVVCQKASGGTWPLLARKFYLDRAPCVMQYLLPLVIETRTAGLRLRNIQSRWVHALLYGHWEGIRPQIASSKLKILLADLGWGSLWVEAITAAILHRKMLLDPPSFAHRRMAADAKPPPGGWVAKVNSLRTKFQIPHFQPDHENATTRSLRRALKKYRRELVYPVTAQNLG